MEQLPQFIQPTLNTIWEVLEIWYWVPLPFVLWGPTRFFWLWWRAEKWIFRQKKVLLEIKMPRDVLKPIRAMEQVFSAIWGSAYDPCDWWEKWWDGKQLDSVQFEMVSLQGEPHLYIRCSEGRRNAIEASIYSQYPDTEISIADDYTKYVPQDSPNKDWEMWGTDYQMAKEDVYPIKTYSKFFEEKEASKEEKRVDPMATLLEGMAKMGPGEQLWIQISADPVTSIKTEPAGDFVSKGRAIADKLAKRQEKAKPQPLLKAVFEQLVFGKIEEVKEEVSMFPPELRLTPGEKEIVEGVENKISKRSFYCYIRFIYIAKRDVYFGGAKAIPFSFFNQFATENLNNLKPWPITLTKVKKYIMLKFLVDIPIPTFDILEKRRLFIKKRKLFFRYVKRMTPLFPKPGGMFLLNIEELATLFHFPGRIVAPAPFVARVESKRGEAPPGLPVE